MKPACYGLSQENDYARKRFPSYYTSHVARSIVADATQSFDAV